MKIHLTCQISIYMHYCLFINLTIELYILLILHNNNRNCNIKFTIQLKQTN